MKVRKHAQKVTTSAELRSMLGATIEALLEGRIEVARANAVASLSSELHKSIKSEFEMMNYMDGDEWSISAQRIVRTKILGYDDER